MEPMLGMIFMIPFEWAPVGYMKCQGQVVETRQYQALLSLIGNLYGGDQSQGTFGLPNLSGRTAIGTGKSTLSSTVYNLARQYGTESTVLNVANLPLHTHTATFTATTGSLPVTIPGTTGDLAVKVNASTVAGTAGGPSTTTMLAAGTGAAVKNYGTVPPAANITALATESVTVTGTPTIPQKDVTINTVTGGSVTIAASGGGTGFPSFQPSLALTFLIAVTGIYPDRP
ncbi:tail fiber protein [Methylobacterium currus]|uniref:phage tail protein n=1 Tax=Methylobacterium currus TaxID=2051553 RepID=UPI001E35438A|nr:tail fiber protein [Methylobacterium currus]UHC15072.1 tail fiber protein [Methylobacterium currus]